MGDRVRAGLRSAAKVLRFGFLAALGLGVVAFVFAFLTNGLDWATGLDWTRKLLLLGGAIMLVVGGCGLLVSGRDRPEDPTTPDRDDTFRAFWEEVGMPWGAAVSVASVGFLVLGTLADLLYFHLA